MAVIWRYSFIPKRRGALLTEQSVGPKDHDQQEQQEEEQLSLPSSGGH